MTTGGYTGMGGPTIAHYQNVMAKMNQSAPAGNFVQPSPQPIQGQFQPQPAPVYTPQVYANPVQPINYGTQPMMYNPQPMMYNPQPMSYVPNVYPQVAPMQNFMATPSMVPGMFQPVMPTSMGFGGPVIPPPSAVSLINDPDIAQGQRALRSLFA